MSANCNDDVTRLESKNSYSVTLKYTKIVFAELALTLIRLRYVIFDIFKGLVLCERAMETRERYTNECVVT